jgi:hypothetical protein
MLVEFDYPAKAATITLDVGEILQDHVLRTAVRHVIDDSAGIWNCDLHLSPETMSDHADTLRDLGFWSAGMVDNLMLLRKSLRHSGDGGNTSVDPNFAVQPPTIPPSREEVAAIAETHQNIDRYTAEVLKKYSSQ